MHWLRRFFDRVGRRPDHDFDRELRDHLEAEAEEQREKGLSEDEARYAARRVFGNATLIREEIRNVWGWSSLERLAQDLRLGVRLLAKNPGFAITGILTLAIGIGANTAIFSVIDAALLRPPAVSQPSRLVSVYSSSEKSRYDTSSYSDYLDYRDQNRSFTALMAYAFLRLNIGVDRTDVQRITGELVSGNYFSGLGVTAIKGRTLSPEDDRAGTPSPVITISARLWRRRFHANPEIIGKELHIDGYPYTIIGVTASAFHGVSGPFAVDVWIPLAMQPKVKPVGANLRDRGTRWLSIVGRLQNQATLASAEADLRTIAQRLALAYPETDGSVHISAEHISTLNPALHGAAIGISGLLLAVTCLVLLIACSNLASLMIARMAARSNEIAIRLALGASRARLLRQFLCESILLAVPGGLLGLLLAVSCDVGLQSVVAKTIPAVADFGFHVDSRVLVFNVIVSLTAGILFGLLPAWRGSQPEQLQSLRTAIGSRGSIRRKLLGRALVIVQVTVSLVLLVISGLFLRSLANASSIRTGFRTDHVVLISLESAHQGYGAAPSQSFYDQFEEKIRRLPGVQSVSVAEHIPLGLSSSSLSVFPEGASSVPEAERIHFNTVGPQYFLTMGIPLLAGRDFNGQDRSQEPRVAIVNQTMARQMFSARSAIGSRFRLGDGKTPDAPLYEIVGVVKDSKYITLGEDARPFFYLPISQQSATRLTVIAHTTVDPRSILTAVRRDLGALNVSMSSTSVATMKDHMGISLLLPKIGSELFGAFALIGLMLAMVGLYGTVAYSVAQRTHEIGVRIALGAKRSDVLKMIIGAGLKLATIGGFIGILVSLALTRLLSSLLYGVSPADPITFILVSFLLLAVTTVASYIPARSATKVDPMVAVRYE